MRPDPVVVALLSHLAFYRPPGWWEGLKQLRRRPSEEGRRTAGGVREPPRRRFSHRNPFLEGPCGGARAPC